jgi:hypothetical protein
MLRNSMSELYMQKYAGINLIDGLRAAEERIMDSIGNLSDMTWIGDRPGMISAIIIRH